jgi:hypothetical protein
MNLFELIALVKNMNPDQARTHLEDMGVHEAVIAAITPLLGRVVVALEDRQHQGIIIRK